MPKQIPFLWYDGEAEQAAALYTGLFPNSSVGAIARYGPDMPMPEGTVLTVEFTLDGQPYIALNGGPTFEFTEAVSFQISCADQAEVDHYWDGLIADGGRESQCGWLKDRFGLSWQVVPTRLVELMGDPDPATAQRVTQAMLGMRRIVVAELEQAAAAD